MTAGIPGVGLSGLFIILSALALPLARRTDTPHRRVGTPFKLGVVMTVCAVVTWQAISEAVTLFHHQAMSTHGHRFAGGISTVGFWPAHVLVISVSIMVLVLLGAEALLHVVGVKLTPTPPPVGTDAQAAFPTSVVSSAFKQQDSSQKIPGTDHEQRIGIAVTPEREGVGERVSPPNKDVAT
jgi:hypothetical protein